MKIIKIDYRGEIGEINVKVEELPDQTLVFFMEIITSKQDFIDKVQAKVDELNNVKTIRETNLQKYNDFDLKSLEEK